MPRKAPDRHPGRPTLPTKVASLDFGAELLLQPRANPAPRCECRSQLRTGLRLRCGGAVNGTSRLSLSSAVSGEPHAALTHDADLWAVSHLERLLRYGEVSVPLSGATRKP